MEKIHDFLSKLNMNNFKIPQDPYLYQKKSQLERAAIQGNENEVLRLIQSNTPITFTVLNNLFKRKKYEFAVQLAFMEEQKFINCVVYLCIAYDQLDLLKKLEQLKIDISDIDNRGLKEASENGLMLMVCHLIEVGGDLNVSLEYGTQAIKNWSQKMIDAKNLHQSLNNTLPTSANKTIDNKPKL